MLMNDGEKITFKDIENGLKPLWKELDKEERTIFAALLQRLSETGDGERAVVLDLESDTEFTSVRLLDEDETINSYVRDLFFYISANTDICHMDQDNDTWIDCQLITGVYCDGNKLKVVFYESMARSIREAFRNGWSPKDLEE